VHAERDRIALRDSGLALGDRHGRVQPYDRCELLGEGGPELRAESR
jgi:hypothetical protein